MSLTKTSSAGLEHHSVAGSFTGFFCVVGPSSQRERSHFDLVMMHLALLNHFWERRCWNRESLFENSFWAGRSGFQDSAPNQLEWDWPWSSSCSASSWCLQIRGSVLSLSPMSWVVCSGFGCWLFGVLLCLIGSFFQSCCTLHAMSWPRFRPHCHSEVEIWSMYSCWNSVLLNKIEDGAVQLRYQHCQAHDSSRFCPRGRPVNSLVGCKTAGLLKLHPFWANAAAKFGIFSRIWAAFGSWGCAGSYSLAKFSCFYQFFRPICTCFYHSADSSVKFGHFSTICSCYLTSTSSHLPTLSMKYLDFCHFWSSSGCLRPRNVIWTQVGWSSGASDKPADSTSWWNSASTTIFLMGCKSDLLMSNFTIILPTCLFYI